VSSQDSNALLADHIRAGLSRPDELGRAQNPLKVYPPSSRKNSSIDAFL
jgi:hypothetical protein